MTFRGAAPLVTLALLSAPGVAAAASSGATCVLVSGKAELVKKGAKAGTPLAKGKAVTPGDTVRTGDGGRVELELPDRSRIRIGAGSDITLDESRFSGKQRQAVSLRVSVGRVWATVAKALGKDTSFEIHTKNAVSGVRGTSFTVIAAQDASAIVRVYAGTVGVRKSATGQSGARKEVPGPKEVDRRQWEEIIATAMKQVKISALGELAPAEDFVDAGEEQEWAEWNRARNREAGIPD